MKWYSSPTNTDVFQLFVTTRLHSANGGNIWKYGYFWTFWGGVKIIAILEQFVYQCSRFHEGEIASKCN